MDLDRFRAYCLARNCTWEDLPFDDSTLTFKVLDKIFAITGIERQMISVNLKCQPEQAIEWRARYDAVQPGYHMNKKHWNTVLLDGRLPDELVFEMVDHSYDMVLRGMTKAKRMQVLEGNCGEFLP